MGKPKYNLVKWFLITCPVIFFSCMSGIDDERRAESTIASEDVSFSLGMMEEIDWMVLSIMQQEMSQFKIIPLLDAGNCPGSIITRDEDQKTIVVNFGEGCVSDRGVEKKGLLTIQFSDHLLQKGAKINMIFESFYLNGYRMDGSRQVENLGYQTASKSMRFLTQMNDFQMTLKTEQKIMLTQSYNRDVQFSNEEIGFRIHLTGGGSMKMMNSGKLTFEIIRPLLYMQECMSWGIAQPTGGSLEMITPAEKTILVDFEGKGC